MNSRIVFLGTGGDAFVVNKQFRSSGGIIFMYEDTQFHINPGPGALVMAKLMGVNLRSNTSIIATGNSYLEAHDVNAVVSAMTHDGLDKRGVLVSPSSVFEGINPFLNSKYRAFLEKEIAVDKTARLGINNVDIEVINITKEQCGFKFVTPRFVMVLLPDCTYHKELVNSLKGADILILHVSDPAGVDREDHMNIHEARDLIEQAKPQLAILTGFGTKMLQADPLYEAREVQRHTRIQVIAAKDGMTINPNSFAATVRQQKLKPFDK